MVVGTTPGHPIRSMTVLVSGADGQLGRAVVQVVAAADHVVALTRRAFDVTIRDDVHGVVAAYRPAVLVNCAAWKDVDAHELDPGRARRINVDAPTFLQEACEGTGTHLVHISTDFVFDGARDDPYPETHSTRPLNVYGATKLEGEAAAGPLATVVRTSWLQDSDGPNVVQRVLDGLTGTGEVVLPGDRWSKPSFSEDVARVVWRLAVERHPGVVHAANDGVTSWADFARAIAEEVGHDPGRIRATSEVDHNPPRPARRPRYSALENMVLRDLDHSPMRHHRDVVKEILGRLQGG